MFLGCNLFTGKALSPAKFLKPGKETNIGCIFSPKHCKSHGKIPTFPAKYKFYIELDGHLSCVWLVVLLDYTKTRDLVRNCQNC